MTHLSGYPAILGAYYTLRDVCPQHTLEAVVFWRPTKKLELPTAETALYGREQALPFAPQHVVLGQPMVPPFPDDAIDLWVGMGCFWGAERKFWQLPGVWTTAVGYAGGFTKNPTYREVCSGATGHTEVVRVVFSPDNVSLEQVLTTFWENHDPTQGMRQGNDVGTQYRSAVFATTNEHLATVEQSRDLYGARLQQAGYGPITTELGLATEFYYAEDYHQQYLHKNPGGYCGMGGTGISCPIGTGA